MRRALRLTGNLLVLGSLLGLVALGTIINSPEPGAAPSSIAGISLPTWLAALPGGILNNGRAASRPANPDTIASQADPGNRSITGITIPSIDLSADVVQADMVSVDGGYTWQVPAFKVGHAETTAGAGEIGNAVLLGHVTSVHSGNVFQELDKIRVGDTVQVFSNAVEFDYRVVSTTAVPRSDSSVLQPTQTPSVSLITCTGMWLPTIWDSTERLVVHAELSQ
jgi:sortase A